MTHVTVSRFPGRQSALAVFVTKDQAEARVRVAFAEALVLEAHAEEIRRTKRADGWRYLTEDEAAVVCAFKSKLAEAEVWEARALVAPARPAGRVVPMLRAGRTAGPPAGR